MTSVEGRWRERYSRVRDRLVAYAPQAALALTGFNACVDAIHRVDEEALERLASAKVGHGQGARLAGEILGRIATGRDGEFALPFPGGNDWVAGTIGPPERLQVGGTGPQAAWSLARLGAPAVVALADRTPEQLAVLHPDVLLCEQGALVPAARAQSRAGHGKPRHAIFEFSAGTRCSGGVLPRSSRLILRFADDGIERDEELAAATSELLPHARAVLVSGQNGIPAGDADSRDWLRRLAQSWRTADLAVIHLELAEFVRSAELLRTCQEYRGVATSLGLNLAELYALSGGPGDPRQQALEAARRFGVERVCVHADRWALSVHRRDPVSERDILLSGNLLAAARAALGAPSSAPELPLDAEITTDLPASGALDTEATGEATGWRADSVPSLYLRCPDSTVGLGDTFVAGCLLAQNLHLNA